MLPHLRWWMNTEMEEKLEYMKQEKKHTWNLREKQIKVLSVTYS